MPAAESAMNQHPDNPATPNDKRKGSGEDLAREQGQDDAYEPLDPARLTWAVLLGRWTEFARSAVALPTEGDAGRVRASVTDIITLQAVWFALQHMDELGPAERAIGLDRAGVLIDRHSTAVRKRFADDPMPQALSELMDEVKDIYHSQR